MKFKLMKCFTVVNGKKLFAADPIISSGNPIITSIFTAEPTARVWSDGRIYVYASHDIFPSGGSFMWAPDVAYKDGTYYFYFPHPSDTNWNSSWKIGVATSDKPAEDFEVQGYIQGIPGSN